MAGTDKPCWVHINLKVTVHRARLAATPVVANATYLWNEDREVFVAIVLGLKHTVAEPCRLESLVVKRSLVPESICLHSDVPFALLVVGWTVGLEMSSLTTVSTAPLRSQRLQYFLVFWGVANDPALVEFVPASTHVLQHVPVVVCLARHREHPVGLNCEFYHS